jgi:hypothetical protein
VVPDGRSEQVLPVRAGRADVDQPLVTSRRHLAAGLSGPVTAGDFAASSGGEHTGLGIDAQ